MLLKIFLELKFANITAQNAGKNANRFQTKWNMDYKLNQSEIYQFIWVKIIILQNKPYKGKHHQTQQHIQI